MSEKSIQEESGCFHPEDSLPSSIGAYNPLEFLYDDDDTKPDKDPPWWLWIIIAIADCIIYPFCLVWRGIKHAYKSLRDWAFDDHND